MQRLINDVMELHKKMGAPINDHLDYTHSLTRMRFLLEELEETINACGHKLQSVNLTDCDAVDVFEDKKEKNDEEILDGLVDLVYVAIGTVIYFGYHNQRFKTDNVTIFEEAWERVHRANMLKIPVKSAAESKRGTEFDLIKPKGWQKPEFGDLIKHIKKGESDEKCNN